MLPGSVDAAHVAEFYDRSDVLVLPTFYEGYGMAVAEALARGIPVVSTRTGAIPDLVGTEAGVLVPPGDEAALAEALRSVIDDPLLRARLQAGAREARSRLRDLGALGCHVGRRPAAIGCLGCTTWNRLAPSGWRCASPRTTRPGRSGSSTSPWPRCAKLRP